MKNLNNGKIRVSDPHFIVARIMGFIKNPTAKESFKYNEWELVFEGHFPTLFIYQSRYV